MQRHAATSPAHLQVTVAPVAAQLAAHAVVAVQRSDRIAHASAGLTVLPGGQDHAAVVGMLVVVLQLAAAAVLVMFAAGRHKVTSQAPALQDAYEIINSRPFILRKLC